MNTTEAIRVLRQNGTVSVPLVGWILAGLTPNAAYEAAKRGALGVPTFKVGKRIRVASALVLARLGIEPPEFGPQEDAPPAAPEPVARQGSGRGQHAGSARPLQTKAAAARRRDGPARKSTNQIEDSGPEAA
jgi:hypothetical protein